MASGGWAEGACTQAVQATSRIKAGKQANVSALGDLSVQGGDVTLVAANVDATNKATIAGSGDVTIASAENRTTHEWTTTNKDCNWWGKCTTTVTHGSTRLQGTQVKAGTFTVNAGVGPKADPNAKILIEGVKETLQTSHTEKSESLMWQAQAGNGSTVETIQLAQINAKTKFSAPGGIDVQLPAGDPLKEQIQSLSQQPGMTWLSDLSQRKDVNWNEVKLC